MYVLRIVHPFIASPTPHTTTRPPHTHPTTSAVAHDDRPAYLQTLASALFSPANNAPPARAFLKAFTRENGGEIGVFLLETRGVELAEMGDAPAVLVRLTPCGHCRRVTDRPDLGAKVGCGGRCVGDDGAACGFPVFINEGQERMN